MWKFNFVKDYNKRPANFFAANYDDSNWKDFPVPGLFELNGYGDATYKNIGYAWATQFDPNPPYISEINNYTGSYRRTFELPKDWKGKDVYFHVGSATSNLTLWVNGKYVGYSEDSKVAAEFNISKYLKPGKNLIAMQVMRWRKRAKKSITYYFAKYYVILGQVIRDTLASITYYFFSPFYFHF